MERRKRRNDEEARNGSRKKGIVPSFSEKQRELGRKDEEGTNEEGMRRREKWK